MVSLISSDKQVLRLKMSIVFEVGRLSEHGLLGVGGGSLAVLGVSCCSRVEVGCPSPVQIWGLEV